MTATYVIPSQAVSDAIYAVFQDPTLLALVPGGVQTDIPISPVYPLLWFEVSETKQFGGFGTEPGVGELPEIELRLHAFSQAAGMAECQTILARAIALIATPPPVAGFGSWGIFHDQTLPLPDQIVNGIKVDELVSFHRLYVEEGQTGVSAPSWIQSGWTQ